MRCDTIINLLLLYHTRHELSCFFVKHCYFCYTSGSIFVFLYMFSVFANSLDYAVKIMKRFYFFLQFSLCFYNLECFLLEQAVFSSKLLSPPLFSPLSPLFLTKNNRKLSNRRTPEFEHFLFFPLYFSFASFPSPFLSLYGCFSALSSPVSKEEAIFSALFTAS